MIKIEIIRKEKEREQILKCENKKNSVITRQERKIKYLEKIILTSKSAYF